MKEHTNGNCRMIGELAGAVARWLAGSLARCVASLLVVVVGWVVGWLVGWDLLVGWVGLLVALVGRTVG